MFHFWLFTYCAAASRFSDATEFIESPLGSHRLNLTLRNLT